MAFECEHIATAIRILNPREVQIARLVGQGKCRKEVGPEIGMSHGSVNAYLSRIYCKLSIGVADGVGSPNLVLALWAREHLSPKAESA